MHFKCSFSVYHVFNLIYKDIIFVAKQQNTIDIIISDAFYTGYGAACQIPDCKLLTRSIYDVLTLPCHLVIVTCCCRVWLGQKLHGKYFLSHHIWLGHTRLWFDPPPKKI